MTSVDETYQLIEATILTQRRYEEEPLLVPGETEAEYRIRTRNCALYAIERILAKLDS